MSDDKLQRYEPETYEDYGMQEADDGDYVRADEALRLIAAIRTERDDLDQALDAAVANPLEMPTFAAARSAIWTAMRDTADSEDEQR